MDPRTSAPDKRLAQLSNTMAMFNLAAGWPSDRERHHQARLRLRQDLLAIGAAELRRSTMVVDVETNRAPILEIQQHNRLQGQVAIELVRRLERLKRTNVDASLSQPLTQAILRIKELAATLSVMTGSRDHLDLGFSLVPTIEVPPPATDDDVEALFRTG